MNYYHLKSILASSKQYFEIQSVSESFWISGDQTRTYIDPVFEKVVYEIEKPAVILISAVGATGKTALAKQLSRDTRLPILDLGKHKPVGDNTLTGLLTTAYDVKNIGEIFQAFSKGAYGVIIDGIDEGRSKTTGKAFEAFLDDIAKLSKGSSATNFAILGRTQVVEECWAYLSDHGISTALLTIAPFDMTAAKKYIDSFTGAVTSHFIDQYHEARDFIIEKLGDAFVPQKAVKSNEFLAFIGYPPVLDAIVTLLTEERNYHKLLQELASNSSRDVEIDLLKRIAEYILNRERIEKVIPNIVLPIVKDTPQDIQTVSLTKAFLTEEQCARLIAFSLRRPLALSFIPETKLNEKYEERLKTWIPEHPFINGYEFRNAVFEALAVATLMVSQNNLFQELASEYIISHKNSYHLIYMLDAISEDHRINFMSLNTVLSSAMEFRSAHTIVELRVSGPDPEESLKSEPKTSNIEIDIEILVGKDREVTKAFNFITEITDESCLQLGPRLGGAFITVPCDITLGNGIEFEISTPLDITARNLRIDSKTLVVRPTNAKENQQEDTEVVIEVQKLQSSVEAVSTIGTSLHFSISDMAGVSYPLIKYAKKMPMSLTDPLLGQKYFRLRRILLEFRSHSRGSMARYQRKIENERVIRNEVGKAILKRLIADKVLTLRDNFYYLDPASLNRHLGVTWHNLRSGEVLEPLSIYLRSIQV